MEAEIHEEPDEATGEELGRLKPDSKSPGVTVAVKEQAQLLVLDSGERRVLDCLAREKDFGT